MSAPCKDCEFRHVGCHAECEVYKDWKKDHEAELKKKSAQAKAIGVTTASRETRTQKWHKNHYNNK